MFNCVMKYLFYNVFGEVLIIFFVAKIGEEKNHSTAAKVFKRTMLEAKKISNTFTLEFLKKFHA